MTIHLKHSPSLPLLVQVSAPGLAAAPPAPLIPAPEFNELSEETINMMVASAAIAEIDEWWTTEARIRW